MKERITYILREVGAGFDPSRLGVEKSSVTVPGIDAVKELQATISVSELPSEVFRLNLSSKSR